MIRKSRNTGRYTLLSIFIAILIPLLFSVFILFLNHRYFYIDDRISDSMPKLFDIGDILRQGDFPWLTSNIMIGGAYAIEYQYSIFNPVHLLLCLILPSFTDYALAAWFMSSVYLMLTGLGGFMLGRNLGLNNSESLVLSAVVSLNFHSLYWNASAWLIALIGFCWVVFGLVFIAAMLHQQKKTLNLAGLFAAYYLCLTSGWPLATLVIALASLLLIAHLLFQRDYLTSFALIGTGTAAVLTASVALFPLFSISELATRSSGINNFDNFLVAPLDGLIAFSDPSYGAFFTSWEGKTRHEAPVFYTSWFLLLLVCITKWSGRKLIDNGGWVWGTLALVFALAAMGPEQLSYIRFPIRFVLYFQLFFIVFVLFSWKQLGAELTRGRLLLYAVLLLIQGIHSFQSNPSIASIIVNYTAAIALLSAFFIVLIRKNRHQGIYLLLSSVIILGFIMNTHFTARGIDWGFPHDASVTNPLGRDYYTLFYGSYVDSNLQPNPHFEYRPSTTGLLGGDRTINGYSPIGHLGFRKILKMSDHGNFDHDYLSAKELFQTDEKTGITHAQLMKIDRIIAWKGFRSADIDTNLSAKYAFIKQTQYTRIYDHNEDYPYPGLVTWVSPRTEIAAEAACQYKHDEECIQILHTPLLGGEIMFARLWYPGYEAYLNGKKLNVSAHKLFWVTVSLPPSEQGTLVLKYLPPNIRLAGLFAVLGLLLFICTLYFYKRKKQMFIEIV